MARGSLNKVILIGNLEGAPEALTIAGEQACNIQLSTTEGWKDKQTGAFQEKVELHRISFIGRLSQIISENFQAKNKVYIEGKLFTEKYQDPSNGQDRYITKIIAHELHFLDSNSTKGCINKVILIGNLGADPELRALANGDSVTNLSVATTDSWKDATTDTWQDKTEWHRVSIFGKSGQVAVEYLHKGSKIYLEGRIRTEKWQDNMGNERLTTKIIAFEKNGMMMMDSKDTKNAYPSSPASSKPMTMETNTNHEHGFDDDIPF